MHEEAKNQLSALLREHGQSVLDDTRRCESLLRDYCTANSSSLNLIIVALRAGVPTGLRREAKRDQVMLRRFASVLENDHFIASDAAKWAVQAWLEALEPGIPATSSSMSSVSSQTAAKPSVPGNGGGVQPGYAPIYASRLPDNASALARALHQAKAQDARDEIDEAIATLQAALNSQRHSVADEIGELDEVIYYLCNLLSNVGQFSRAVALCRERLAAGESGLVLAALAMTHSQLDDDEAGVDLARRASELEPTRAETWLAVVSCVGGANPDEQRAALDTARNCAPLDIDAEASVAFWDVSVNKDTRALAKARARSPRNRSVLLAYAISLMMGGLREQALLELESLHARCRRSWMISSLIAYFELLGGNLPAAADAARKALAVNPRAPIARIVSVTTSFRDDGDAAAAAKALAGIRRDFPRNGDICEPLCDVYLACNDIQSAMSEAKLARLLQPDLVDSHLLLPGVLAQAGDHATAATLLDEVVKKWPDSPLASRQFGSVLLELGRTDEADQVLQNLHDDEDSRFVVGRLLCYRGDWPGLEAHCSRWLRRAGMADNGSTSNPLRLDYAMALAEQGKARQLSTWLSQSQSEGPEFTVMLANAYANSGDKVACERLLGLKELSSCQNLDVLSFAHKAAHRASLEDLKLTYAYRYVELAPDDADMRYCLGDAYEAKGNVSLAEEQYRHALAIEPRHYSAANDLAISLWNREGATRQVRALLRITEESTVPKYLTNVIIFEILQSCPLSRVTDIVAAAVRRGLDGGGVAAIAMNLAEMEYSTEAKHLIETHLRGTFRNDPALLEARKQLKS